MRVTRWRWLALLPLAGTMALLTWNVIVLPLGEESSAEVLAGLVGFLSAASFAAIGSYLAVRLPTNAVGWLMTIYGFLFAAILTSEAAVATGSVPTREWLAWFGSWAWAVTGAVVTILLPLLFPDGKLPSRRWRWVLRAALIAVALLFVANAFSPDSTAPIRNPLGRPEWREPLSTIGLVGFVLYATCIASGVVAVVKRFRRSRGVVRRQMQVFAASAVLIAVGTAIGYSAYETGLVVLANLVLASVTLLVPLALGMAILKYRLYELGRIFKRTVTYSVVAAVLVATYALAVVGLQTVLGADDSLSVAASTLAVAALFNPVRTRVQDFVNRHFDRSRYNASLVVEEFSARLSQQIDVNQLNADLAILVDRTLRPARLAVWLREQP